MAIPSDAKKVFQGIIFDVYHWEQKQFDGTVKTFEGLKRPDNVVIIALVGDKIYLQKEEQPSEPPFTGLPAGRFDAGETDPLLVGRRELLEETGYASDDFRLLRFTKHEEIIEWTTHVVVAHNCSKIAEPHLDAGERLHGTMLVSFDEYLELSKHPEFRGGELAVDCMKAGYDPDFREAFRRSIFGAK